MYTRVIVPLDGSSAAEAILPFVVDITAPLELDVVLVSVVEWRPVSSIERGGHVPAADLETSMGQSAQYLSGIARRLRQRGVRARTLVRYGAPAREILAGAAAVEADLVAMTTHGRTGVGRLLFGSVAAAVLRRAEIPVFLMRLTGAAVWPETPPAVHI